MIPFDWSVWRVKCDLEKTCLHKAWIIPKSAFVTRIMEGNKCVTYKSIYTEKSHKKSIYKSHSPASFFFMLSGFLDMILNFSDKDASTAPKYCNHGFSKTDTYQ